MLSAVGGTMGLLTGFSIMSAIEILFFIFKSLVGSLMKISQEIIHDIDWLNKLKVCKHEIWDEVNSLLSFSKYVYTIALFNGG